MNTNSYDKAEGTKVYGSIVQSVRQTAHAHCQRNEEIRDLYTFVYMLQI